MNYEMLGSIAPSGFWPMPPWKWYNSGLPAGYAGPDLLVDPEFGIVNIDLIQGSPYEMLGAMAPRTTVPTLIRAPNSVIVTRRNFPQSDTWSEPREVRVYGGKYWVPDWNPSDNMWSDNPTKVIITLKNGFTKTYLDAKEVTVRGGARGTGILRRIWGDAPPASHETVGAEYTSAEMQVVGAYTDAFTDAKKQVDDVLDKAESFLQKAAVIPFRSAEAQIFEGFRRGIETKDVKLVDKATVAMRELASLVRKTLIDPSTGEVKSLTQEVAVKAIQEAGGELKKAQEQASSALSWVKWALIIGGIAIVLIVGGSIVVPLIIRRRLRMF